MGDWLPAGWAGDPLPVPEPRRFPVYVLHVGAGPVYVSSFSDLGRAVRSARSAVARSPFIVGAWVGRL